MDSTTNECFKCHSKTIDNLISKHKTSNEIQRQFKTQCNELLINAGETENPLLAAKIHRIAKELLANDNLYEDEKNRANELLLQNYAYWKSLVQDAEDPFYTAIKLAVAGNVIDYGAHSVPENIEHSIKAIIQKPFAIDHTGQLYQAIQKANNILYLGDNAGEIVFDKLLIETISPSFVTFVVRGKPIINDVTFDDALQTNMHKTATIISNGYDAPSTLLEYCSFEFKEAFNNADLIISKGQGNFEGLMNSNRKDIFFLLMAKCDPMANLLGVKAGDLVVKKNIL